LITIQNYSKYQDSEEGTTDTRTDSQADNQTTVERQSSGTNKNVNNVNNGKKLGEPSTLQTVTSLKQQSLEEEWEENPQPPRPKPTQPHHSRKENPRPVRSRRAKTTLPADFAISEDHREYARLHNIPAIEVEFEKFKNYHLSKGTVFVDWDAAF